MEEGGNYDNLEMKLLIYFLIDYFTLQPTPNEVEISYHFGILRSLTKMLNYWTLRKIMDFILQTRINNKDNNLESISVLRV